jgi:hypothetical protein
MDGTPFNMTCQYNAILYLIYNVVETWQSDGPRIEGEGVKTLLS